MTAFKAWFPERGETSKDASPVKNVRDPEEAAQEFARLDADSEPWENCSNHICVIMHGREPHFRYEVIQEMAPTYDAYQIDS